MLPQVTDAKRRLLDHLLVVEHATAPDLAGRLSLTDAGIRQHLDALVEAGLVEPVKLAASGRGRPPMAYRVTAAAHDLYPDRHVDLTVELLSAMRRVLGDQAVANVLADRGATQRAAYQHEVSAKASLSKRVATLAAMRSAEGYAATSTSEPNGSVTLTEHHCPIAAAARSCGELCDAELTLFRSVLGPNVTIERREHLMAGDQRCSYSVRPA
jgi:predicted ArsR family transcriptional regulator